jgi:hypothetical protein
MVLSALSDLQTQEVARRANERPLPPEKPPHEATDKQPPMDEAGHAVEATTQAQVPEDEAIQEGNEPAPTPNPAPKETQPAPKGHEPIAPPSDTLQQEGGALVDREIAHLGDRIEALMRLQREEKIFLGDLKERLLVLFEGLQSPNNKQIEAKVDLILNFLEYLLATTEERLESLDCD